MIEVNFLPVAEQQSVQTTMGAGNKFQQQDGPIGSHACDEVAEFAETSGLFRPLTPRDETSCAAESP